MFGVMKMRMFEILQTKKNDKEAHRAVYFLVHCFNRLNFKENKDSMRCDLRELRHDLKMIGVEFDELRDI